mmetsp:Transcript_16156/g.31661  ORF Transcript_16156/g.31661 Transcript_16156/m.31661 type:complete len:228 (+) Transcript_16156:1251-1934(+)
MFSTVSKDLLCRLGQIRNRSPTTQRITTPQKLSNRKKISSPENANKHWKITAAPALPSSVFVGVSNVLQEPLTTRMETTAILVLSAVTTLCAFLSKKHPVKVLYPLKIKLSRNLLRNPQTLLTTISQVLWCNPLSRQQVPRLSPKIRFQQLQSTWTMQTPSKSVQIQGSVCTAKRAFAPPCICPTFICCCFTMQMLASMPQLSATTVGLSVCLQILNNSVFRRLWPG